MIRTLSVLLGSMLLIPAVFCMPVVADSAAQLEVNLVGGLPLPFFFHFVGGSIANIGDITASNISYTMTIQGGILGTTNETLVGFQNEIQPKQAYAVGINNAYGFGVVTITMVASASNAANVTTTAHGLQLGGFTWIPFSWIRIMT